MVARTAACLFVMSGPTTDCTQSATSRFDPSNPLALEMARSASSISMAVRGRRSRSRSNARMQIRSNTAGGRNPTVLGGSTVIFRTLLKEATEFGP
jgi:hypothetical protein